jgi:hypothetical protein
MRSPFEISEEQFWFLRRNTSHADIAELACRTALSYRGVAHISIPVDFQEEEVVTVKDIGCSEPNVPKSHVRRAHAQRAPPLRRRPAQSRRDSESRQAHRDFGGAGALHAREECDWWEIAAEPCKNYCPC